MHADQSVSQSVSQSSLKAERKEGRKGRGRNKLRSAVVEHSTVLYSTANDLKDEMNE